MADQVSGKEDTALPLVLLDHDSIIRLIISNCLHHSIKYYITKVFSYFYQTNANKE